jgi:uncharacterized protein (TIGR02679 family)
VEWKRASVNEVVDVKEKEQKLIFYLRQHAGFHRLLEEMRKKYYSFGTVKGTLVLKDATAEEKEAIGGLIQRNFYSGGDIRISTVQLQKAFEGTPYAKCTLDELVLTYFGSEAYSKRDEQQKQQQAEERFFSEIIGQRGETRSGAWLREAFYKRSYGWEYLHRCYRRDVKRLRAGLEKALNGADHLPVFDRKSRRLALFSAEITGNPHTFDYGTMESYMLLYILRFYFYPEKMGGITEVDKMKLYHQAGIRRDDLLNNTTVYGISCLLEDGQEHEGARGFRKDFEPMVLTLHLLLRTQRVLVNGSGAVYVVENSGVFAELVQRLGNREVAVICTNGQMTEASVLILEMLAEQGHEIYYSGDFDPEGLLIADRLKQRIPKVHLWRFTVEDYRACCPCVELDASRLQKLRGVRDEALRMVAAVLAQQGLAGYQEGLLELYLGDIWQSSRYT